VADTPNWAKKGVLLGFLITVLGGGITLLTPSEADFTIYNFTESVKGRYVEVIINGSFTEDVTDVTAYMYVKDSTLSIPLKQLHPNNTDSVEGIKSWRGVHYNESVLDFDIREFNKTCDYLNDSGCYKSKSLSMEKQGCKKIDKNKCFYDAVIVVGSHIEGRINYSDDIKEKSRNYKKNNSEIFKFTALLPFNGISYELCKVINYTYKKKRESIDFCDYDMTFYNTTHAFRKQVNWTESAGVARVTYPNYNNYTSIVFASTDILRFWNDSGYEVPYKSVFSSSAENWSVITTLVNLSASAIKSDTYIYYDNTTAVTQPSYTWPLWLWYPFDFSNVLDYSGNSRNGSGNPPTYVTAVTGIGGQFDGSSDCIDVAINYDFDKLTVTAFANATGHGTDDSIAGNYYTADFQREWEISVGWSGTQLSNLVSYDGTSGNITRFHSTAALTANTWIHTGVVLDNSGLSQAFYMHGAFDESNALTYTINALGGQNLGVGCQTGAAGGKWTGQLDEVMFWEANLTASEVAGLNATPAPTITLGAEESATTTSTTTTSTTTTTTTTTIPINLTHFSPVNQTSFTDTQFVNMTCLDDTAIVNSSWSTNTSYIQWNITGNTNVTHTLIIPGSTVCSATDCDFTYTWNCYTNTATTETDTYLGSWSSTTTTTTTSTTTSTTTTTTATTTTTTTTTTLNPVVTHLNPTNSSTLDYLTIFLNASVTDSDSGIANASLYLNGTLNMTNYTTGNGTKGFNIVFAEANYGWIVQGCDLNNSCANATAAWEFSITDNPIVTISSPANASIDGDGDLTISYTVSDLSEMSNCSLYWGSYGTTITLDQTDSTIVKAGDSFAKTGLSDGSYAFNITCFDIAGNTGSTTGWLRIKFLFYTPKLRVTYCWRMKYNSTTNYGILFADCWLEDQYSRAVSNPTNCTLNYYNYADDLVMKTTDTSAVGNVFRMYEIAPNLTKNRLYNIYTSVYDSVGILHDANIPYFHDQDKC